MRKKNRGRRIVLGKVEFSTVSNELLNIKRDKDTKLTIGEFPSWHSKLEWGWGVSKVRQSGTRAQILRYYIE